MLCAAGLEWINANSQENTKKNCKFSRGWKDKFFRRNSGLIKGFLNLNQAGMIYVPGFKDCIPNWDYNICRK